MTSLHTSLRRKALAVRALPVVVTLALVGAACANPDSSVAVPPVESITASTDESVPSGGGTTATVPATQDATGTTRAPAEPALESRLLETDCPALAAGRQTLDKLLWGILEGFVQYLPEGERTWEAVADLLDGISTRSPEAIASHLKVLAGRLDRVSGFYEGVDVSYSRGLYETDDDTMVSRVWVIRQSDEYSGSFDAVSGWVAEGCPGVVQVSGVAATAPSEEVGQLAEGVYTGFGSLTIGLPESDTAGVVRALGVSPQGWFGLLEFRDDGVRFVASQGATETGGSFSAMGEGVATTRAGAVWVPAEGKTSQGGSGTGLARWQEAGWRFHELTAEVWGCEADPEDEIACHPDLTSVAVGPDDAVWAAGTYSNADLYRPVVVRFDGSNWQDFSSGAPEYIRTIRVADDGSVWALTTDGIIASLLNGTWTIHDLDAWIDVLEPSADGKVVIGGSNYVATFVDGRATEILAGDDPYGISIDELFSGDALDTDTEKVLYWPQAIAPTSGGRVAVLFRADRLKLDENGRVKSGLARSVTFVSVFEPDGWVLLQVLEENPDLPWLGATPSGDILVAVTGEQVLRLRLR